MGRYILDILGRGDTIGDLTMWDIGSMSKYYGTARIVGLLLILACLFSCKPPVYQFTATLTSIEERVHHHVRGFPPGGWTTNSWTLTFDNGAVVKIGTSLPRGGAEVGRLYSVFKDWSGFILTQY